MIAAGETTDQTQIDPSAIYTGYDIGDFVGSWTEEDKDIHSQIMNLTKKLLKGDFSLSPEMQKQIDDSVGRVREPALKMIEEMEGQVGKTYKTMQDAITSYADRIKQTGLEIGDALDEVGRQVKATGASMSDALETSISYNRQLTEMGLQDINKELRKNMAEKAAQLGRAPTDPNFIKELQAETQKEMQRAYLQQGALEAEGRMGIAERTGSGLESVAQQKASLAERTGSGLEEAEANRMSWAERTALAKEDLMRERGQVNVGAAEMGEQMRWKYGTEFPLTAIQIGQGGLEWSNRFNTQIPMSNILTSWSPITGQQTYGFNERASQPTTTVTQTPSAADVVGGFAGIAATGAGLGMQGYGISSMNRNWSNMFNQPANRVGGVAGMV